MKMKKMMAALLLGVAVASPAMAQNQNANDTTWDHWFISAGFGAQYYVGEADTHSSLKDWASPALDVSVGKWINQNMGVRLSYSGLEMNGTTFQNGKREFQDFKYGNIHADFLFNASNFLMGVKHSRFWNCSPYAGVGFAMRYDEPKKSGFTFNLGVYNAFPINRHLDVNLDLRASMMPDKLDLEKGNDFPDGTLSATLGLTYKF